MGGCVRRIGCDRLCEETGGLLRPMRPEEETSAPY